MTDSQLTQLKEGELTVGELVDQWAKG